MTIFAGQGLSSSAEKRIKVVFNAQGYFDLAEFIAANPAKRMEANGVSFGGNSTDAAATMADLDCVLWGEALNERAAERLAIGVVHPLRIKRIWSGAANTATNIFIHGFSIA